MFMSRGSKRFQSTINYPFNFMLRNKIKKFLQNKRKYLIY